MSLPGARSSRRRLVPAAVAAAAADSLNQLIPQAGDAVLKLVVVLGIPLGALGPGDGVLAREGNVQDVVVVVARVAVDAAAKARRGKGDGGFADHGLGAVVAVLVAPDAVDLRDGGFSFSNRHSLWPVCSAEQGHVTYQLVVAHDGHDAQRLDAVLPRVKVCKALPAARVAKDDVRMGIGVEIALAGAVAAEGVSKGRDGLGVARGAAATVVGWAVLDAVAVDVHVDQLAVFALQVDDVVVADVVAAVAKVYGLHVRALCLCVYVWSRSPRGERI